MDADFKTQLEEAGQEYDETLHDEEPIEELETSDDEEQPEVQEEEEEQDENAFTLEQPGDDNLVRRRIRYMGQEIDLALTEDEHTAILQQGYDYSRKMGPHRKLVELIDTDPGIRQAVNDYLTGKQPKAKLEIEPLTEDGDPNEWMAKNLEKVREAYPQERPAAPAAQQEQPSPAMQEAFRKLQFHDSGENLQKILPEMPRVAQEMLKNGELTQEVYQQINNNPDATIQFYDHVKRKISGGTAPPKATVAKKKTFRSKSGGGSQGEKKGKDAWDLDNKQFKAFKEGVMGYSS